jgi:hypothetical protein
MNQRTAPPLGWMLARHFPSSAELERRGRWGSRAQVMHSPAPEPFRGLEFLSSLRDEALL